MISRRFINLESTEKNTITDASRAFSVSIAYSLVHVSVNNVLTNLLCAHFLRSMLYQNPIAVN